MSRFRGEVCDYAYEDAGAPREDFPAGTAWSDVPDDRACPDCGVREKPAFIPHGGAAGADVPRVDATSEPAAVLTDG